ncbi:MAG: ferritin family protein [Candidatus Aenigmarchaeota archaeon]|nr:rubrerythrin [Candidatus Aenigmarchaeota archaeon]MCX8190783.1 rubrerythrin [Candidatus Aenigmarchaeota archaeon]MDW8160030.1 ferritin family protein [Candidatus Aenigmarchaeota archaeon]
MLAEKPIKIDEKDVEKQILRLGIIAELDAVSLYEQLAARASNEKIKKVFLDIAKEEKTHVGEFLALLLELDKQQKKELEEGKKEVEEI